MLGARDAQVHVTGNLKFDLSFELPCEGDDLLRRIREALGLTQDGRTIVVGSSMKDEEPLYLRAFARVLTAVPEATLVLAPRHPERFDQVAALLEQRCFQYARRSTNNIVNSDTQVLLGDTMGELVLLMAAGDAVFVGGSLVKTGGHNVLEPIALGLPTVTGPHVFNFQTICDSLFAVDGLRQVESAADLADVWREWLVRRPQQQIDNASRVLAENRGASARQLALISQYL